MRYCKRWLMPDTMPGITFNEEGICSACQCYDKMKEVDWEKRLEEVEILHINITE